MSNVCKTCKADNGRAGMLLNGECLNCYHTRKTGDVCIHSGLSRTDAEIQATMGILNKNERLDNKPIIGIMWLSTQPTNME
jgi:hypothetical protein